MLETESAVLIEMAKEFARFLIAHAPGWREGYFRFTREVHGNTVAKGCSASCVVEGPSGETVRLLGGFDENLDAIRDWADKLFGVMRKDQGVVLLTINSKFKYNAHFDFSDLSRWEITKMDGGTGIPKDVPQV